MALSCHENTICIVKGITSNPKRDFYCLKFFHLYSTENKLKKYKSVSKLLLLLYRNA